MKYAEISYWSALIGVWMSIGYGSFQISLGLYKFTRKLYVKLITKKLE